MAVGPRSCEAGGVRGSRWPAPTGARRTARASQRRVRGRDDDGIIPVLARTVREVEAAAQRGRVMPSVRTKFQVVALLVREERARVRAESQQRRPPGRRAQAPRRDRADPRADRRPRHVAARAARRGRRRLRRGPVAQAGHAAGRRDRAGARRGHAPGAAGRPRRPRAPGGAAVGRLAPAGQPLPRPRLLGRQAERGPGAPPGQLGAARPAVQLVRTGRRRAPRRAWRCPRRRSLQAPGGLDADAAPGAAGRRGRRRPPDLPARRRAGPGQDGAGAARRAGGERLPAARGRAERRQDQLGPRGRRSGPPTARPP